LGCSRGTDAAAASTFPLEGDLARLEFVEPGLQTRGAQSVGDSLDDAIELSGDIVELLAVPKR
jgi:hypothetical protein